LTATPAGLRLITLTRSSTGGRFVPKSQTGSVWVYGSVLAYGVPLTDSVQYGLKDATNQNISVSSVLVLSNAAGYSIDAAGATSYLAAGGTVTFNYNSSLSPADTTKFTVTFDNTAGITSTSPNFSNGTITKLGQNNPAAGMVSPVILQMNSAGTYHWTMTGSGPGAFFRNGLNSGSIVVRP
jgi:hypothetical protein